MAKRVDVMQRAKEALARECPKCGMPPTCVCMTDRGRPRLTFCKERTDTSSTVYAIWATNPFRLDDEEEVSAERPE